MTIRTIYHINEKCRVTEDGPEVYREYRLGDDEDAMDSLSFIYGPYTESGFPVLGEAYSARDDIFVSDVQAQRTGADKEWNSGDLTMMLHVWKVTVQWKPPPELKNLWEAQDLCIYDMSIFGETVDMDGRYDWSNNANMNSAGEFYEDRLPIQAPVTVVRFTEKALTLPNMALYKKVNNAAWWSGANKTWLCRNVSGEFVHNEKEQYWKNSYEFAYNPLNWQLKKLDSGYYHRTTESGVLSGSRVRNTNDDGSENERPCLLNGYGALLEEGGTPMFQYFDIYASAAFPSSLPNPFA